MIDTPCAWCGSREGPLLASINGHRLHHDDTRDCYKEAYYHPAFRDWTHRYSPGEAWPGAVMRAKRCP